MNTEISKKDYIIVGLLFIASIFLIAAMGIDLVKLAGFTVQLIRGR